MLRKKRTRADLAGTNLALDVRTGMYFWRMVNPVTGKRMKRSTGTRFVKVALARARRFEEDMQRECAGLSRFEGYRRPIRAFVEPFLLSLRGGSSRRERLRKDLARAFDLLGIERLADIENFIKVEEKLLALEGTGQGGFRRRTLRRCFQEPLKQLSAYLASRRETMADHLGPWRRLSLDEPSRERRALHPDEMARALAASDRLDEVCDRKHSLRPVWTALLVTAPRISTLAALDVSDLDEEKKRLRFRGNDIKRAGVGALDDGTFDEIVEYIGERADGPLFLSPEGSRPERLRSLDYWRAALSLAFVDMEWPAGRPRDLKLEYLVHLTLVAGVPEILIDRQLGHTSPAGEAAQSAAWSLIGRKHYTDMSFLALDAKKSADAVRGVLDRGEAELTEVAAEGGTALVATERVVRKAARR
jgi:integrase